MFILHSPAFEERPGDASEVWKEGAERLASIGVGGRARWDRIFRARLRRHSSGRQRLRALVGRRRQPAAQLAARRGGGAKRSGFLEVKPYIGPFPPSGTHDYEFTLYALRTDKLGVQPGATLQQFRQAAEQNSLGTATLMGKFTKIR